jgi:hypothetical protein
MLDSYNCKWQSLAGIAASANVDAPTYDLKTLL